MQNNPTLMLVVAAALLRPDGKVLLQKRPENRSLAGLWEFPGGKVEVGELPEAALVRELAEELAVRVLPEDLTPACFASAPVNDKHMLLLLYICRSWQGEPRGVESPELDWFTCREMRHLAMPPADLPLIALLENLL
jgi:8-oxo-dGTP diphosphatase